MAGEYFGNKYFPKGYFPDGYFGIESEVDPNAMRGTAAGVATVTGTLSAIGNGFIAGSATGSATVSGELTYTGTPEVVTPPIRTGTGGGGFWVSHSDDGEVRIRIPVRVRLPGLVATAVRVQPTARGVVADVSLPTLVCGKPSVKTDDVLEVLRLMQSDEFVILRLLQRAA